MVDITNQIRVTLALNAQQYTAGMQQAAQTTTGLGTAAAGIQTDLAAAVAQIRAMGNAAMTAQMQLERVRVEQAGLATTGTAAARVTREQAGALDMVTGSGRATSGVMGTLAGSLRVAAAGFAALKLLQFAGDAAVASDAFDRYGKRIEILSGNAGLAGMRLGFLERESNRLGTALDGAARNYSVLLGATTQSLDDAQRNNLFSVLTAAGQRYKLTSEQTEANFDQLARIAGRTKVTLDDLGGTLGTNLPQSLDAIAIGLGVTTEQLRRMIADGQIAGAQVLPALAIGLSETFGLAAQRDIDQTRDGVERVRNELLLLANAARTPVAAALRNIADTVGDDVAELLQYVRQNGVGSTALLVAQDVGLRLQGRNEAAANVRARVGNTNRARDFVEANPFRPQLFEPNAARPAPFFGPGQPAVDQLTGASLLSLGVTPPDPRRQREAERLAERERSAAARELASIEAERHRAAAAALGIEVRAEDSRLKAIADARVQAAIIMEELRTGQALSGAARELFVLKQNAREPVDETLRLELETLAALEAQVEAKRDAETLLRDASTARNRADRGADSFLRRREPTFERDRNQQDAQPFERLANTRDALQGREDAEFGRQRGLEAQAQRAEISAGTEDFEAFAEREAELAEAHAQRKLQIDRDYAAARLAVYLEIADATTGVLSDLADVAQNFGAKGFAAYKAFAIAETLISTYSSAQKAFESLSAIPFVGPILGGVAAAAAVAQGLQQVGRIRAQQPAGRQFGGPVGAGQLYEVGEGGRPEILRQNGRSYLIPGNSGEVVPASVAARSSSGIQPANVSVQVQVVNQHSGAAVRVDEQRTENGGTLIRLSVSEVVRDLREGGPVSSELSRSYGLRRVGRTI